MGDRPAPLNHLEKPFDDFSNSEEGRAYWRSRRVDERDLYVTRSGEKHDVDVSDVNQDQGGDCFFVAGLAAIVGVHPHPDDFLKDIIRINGDGTYTVTLYEFSGGSRSTREVRLDKNDLEAAARDYHLYKDTIQPARPEHSNTPEWWPVLVEKAYWKAFPSREGGNLNPGTGMERLTGLESTVYALDRDRSPDVPPYVVHPKLSFEALASYQDRGFAITFTTFPHESPHLAEADVKAAYFKYSYNEGNVRRPMQEAHAYFVTKVDVASRTVTVQNPWQGGHQDIVIPYDDINNVFQGAQMNPVKFAAGAPLPAEHSYPRRQ